MATGSQTSADGGGACRETAAAAAQCPASVSQSLSIVATSVVNFSFTTPGCWDHRQVQRHLVDTNCPYHCLHHQNIRHLTTVICFHPEAMLHCGDLLIGPTTWENAAIKFTRWRQCTRDYQDAAAWFTETQDVSNVRLNTEVRVNASVTSEQYKMYTRYLARCIQRVNEMCSQIM